MGDQHQRFLDEAMPHFDAVFNVARRSTPDRAAAEDLAQETYTRAFAAYGRYAGGSMRSWLVSICLNTARSQVRRDRRRPAVDAAVELDGFACVGRDVADSATAKVASTAVLAALDQLPEAQRTAVVLMDLAGLSASEVASIVGCPRGTVLSRVFRAHQRLAVLLERERVSDGL